MKLGPGRFKVDSEKIDRLFDTVDFDKDGQYVDIYITADTEDEALKLADAEAKSCC